MTKSEFEEVLRDQGYKVQRRFSGDYWHKSKYPTYITHSNCVIVLRGGDEVQDGRYSLEEGGSHDHKRTDGELST